MDILVHTIVIIFIVLGLFFFMVGTVGLIRLPDAFTRMHATTKCDTLGAGLVLLGVIIWQGFGFVSLNVLVILTFIWLTNPTAAHFIAKTQYQLDQQNTKDKEESL